MPFGKELTFLFLATFHFSLAECPRVSKMMRPPLHSVSRDNSDGNLLNYLFILSFFTATSPSFPFFFFFSSFFFLSSSLSSFLSSIFLLALLCPVFTAPALLLPSFLSFAHISLHLNVFKTATPCSPRSASKPFGKTSHSSFLPRAFPLHREQASCLLQSITCSFLPPLDEGHTL